MEKSLSVLWKTGQFKEIFKKLRINQGAIETSKEFTELKKHDYEDLNSLALRVNPGAIMRHTQKAVKVECVTGGLGEDFSFKHKVMDFIYFYDKLATAYINLPEEKNSDIFLKLKNFRENNEKFSIDDPAWGALWKDLNDITKSAVRESVKYVNEVENFYHSRATAMQEIEQIICNEKYRIFGKLLSEYKDYLSTDSRGFNIQPKKNTVDDLLNKLEKNEIKDFMKIYEEYRHSLKAARHPWIDSMLSIFGQKISKGSEVCDKIDKLIKQPITPESVSAPVTAPLSGQRNSG